MRAQIRLKPTTATPVPGVEFGVFVDVVDGADSSLLNKKVRAQRRPAGRFECARSRRAAPRARPRPTSAVSTALPCSSTAVATNTYLVANGMFSLHCAARGTSPARAHTENRATDLKLATAVTERIAGDRRRLLQRAQSASRRVDERRLRAHALRTTGAHDGAPRTDQTALNLVVVELEKRQRHLRARRGGGVVAAR